MAGIKNVWTIDEGESYPKLRIFVGNNPHTISKLNTSYKTKNSITISWETDEAVDSVVEYGVTDSYGENVSDSSENLSHSLKLTGLSSGTTYHFQVNSTDAAGNTENSSDITFTTCKNSSDKVEVSSGNDSTVSSTHLGTGTEASVKFDTISSDSTILGFPVNNPGGYPPANPVRHVSITSDIPDDNIENVEISINYTEGEISSLDVYEDSLSIYYWNGSSWEDKNASVDKDANTATIQVDHFSDYSLMGTNNTTIGGKSSPTDFIDVWLPYISIAVLIIALVISAILSGKEWLSNF